MGQGGSGGVFLLSEEISKCHHNKTLTNSVVIYEFPQVALCLKLAPHPAHQHFHWSCKAKLQILQKMRDLLKSRTTSPRKLAKLWDSFAKMTLLRIVRSAVPGSPSLLVTVFTYWASAVLF